MIKLLLLWLNLICVIVCQEFHSPEQRKIFGDYLFCSEDYLRAILEYDVCLSHFSSDTLQYKIAVSNFNLHNFEQAANSFKKITELSEFYPSAKLGFLKSKIFSEDYESINNFQADGNNLNELKLTNLSLLLGNFNLPEKDRFLIPFDNSEAKEISQFYDLKSEPCHKSPLLAGIFSTIIPGSGKIYTGQVNDGITAFLLSSLFAFLSYNNFENNHNARGWIFAGTSALFYAGNIYGSVASAHLYNFKYDYEYKELIKQYLDSKNYYMSEYDFCK